MPRIIPSRKLLTSVDSARHTVMRYSGRWMSANGSVVYTKLVPSFSTRGMSTTMSVWPVSSSHSMRERSSSSRAARIYSLTTPVSRSTRASSSGVGADRLIQQPSSK